MARTQRVHDYSRHPRSGHRRSPSNKNRTPTDRSRIQEAAPRPPSEPKEENPFRPQPGDVIVRMLPPTPGLTTSRVLGVMGLIKIYADDYYFVYEHGAAHIVKFTFRSRDRILRAGQFVSRMFHWRFEEMASLYIYWQADPAQPGRWHMIAQQGNEWQEYISYMPDEMHFERRGDTMDENMFTVMPGDYVIHPLAVVASDRPWGQSFELRVVPPFDMGVDMFGAGDIVLRMRLSSPTKDDLFSLVPHDVMELVADYMFDVFVPMYVYGFLCLGKSGPGYGGIPRQLWNGRWRYLGSDHQIFRNYATTRRSWENRGLQQFSSCPLLPGDIIINLDEVLHPPGANPSYHLGHIKIQGDKEAALDRAQDLPGTMIIRLGGFMSPEDRASTELKIHRTHWLENGRRDAYLYSCWVEFVSPTLIVRDQLVEGHWIEASMASVSRLNDEPPVPPEGPAPVFPEDKREFGVGFVPRDTPLYHHVRVGLLNPWTAKDLVLSTAVSLNNISDMLIRPQRSLHRVDRITYVEQYESDEEPGPDDPQFENDIIRIFHRDERKFSLFYYPQGDHFADGDHVIRFKCEESTTQPGCWVLSVELHAYRVIPWVWNTDRESVEISALKGRDQIILPNLIAGEARRPPGLWVNDGQ